MVEKAQGMNRRIGVNILLLLVFVALFSFIRYQENQEQQTIVEQRLSSLDIEEIISFEYSFMSSDGERIERQFKKQEAASNSSYWLMQKPAVAYANKKNIDYVLTLLRQPVLAQYEASKHELATFDLKPGLLDFTVSDQLYTFGSLSPVSSQRYILHQGYVNMVQDRVYGNLVSSNSAWVSHQLIPPNYTIKHISGDARFIHAAQSLAEIKAIKLSDYTGKEKVTGFIRVEFNASDTLLFDVLESSSTTILTLGRPDLKVKYDLDKAQLIRAQ